MAPWGFLFSQSILFLHCEPYWPNTKDTGAKTITSHCRMFLTSVQPTGSCLACVCIKDPVFCRQLTAKFQEFLLSLIYHLIVILLLSSSSQSYCEQGDRSMLVALCSSQNTAPTSQSSVLALTKEDKTGSLWRRCCSEILQWFWSNPSLQLSKCPPLHYQSQRELNLNSQTSSQLCCGCNMKPNLSNLVWWKVSMRWVFGPTSTCVCMEMYLEGENTSSETWVWSRALIHF